MMLLGRTLVVVAPPRSVGGTRACVAVGAAAPDTSPSLLRALPGLALMVGPTLLCGWIGYTYWGFWGMQIGTAVGVTATLAALPLVLPLVMTGSDLP